MKTVDVVIPVHNSAHWLAWCLEELFRFNFASLRSVFVIDDHSALDQAGKIKEIAARYPQVQFTVNEDAEGGFGYACNLGASKCSSDIILFLNTDCLVTEGVIDRLAKVFDADSEIALACPFSNNSSNITYPMLPGFSYRDMAALLDQISSDSETTSVIEACTVVGNCLMVRRDFFERVGGFASEWGVGYGEETDLHMKALSEGLKGVVHTGCYVYHYGGGTFNYEAEIQAHREKNYQLFMSKWANEYNKLAARCENINPVHIVDTNLDKYWKNKDKVVELDALFSLLKWANEHEISARNENINPVHLINEKLGKYWENKNKVIELDVLFYLPGIDQGVGGVNAVIAICNDLIRRGLKAGVALIGVSDLQLENYRETVLFNFLHYETNEAFLADNKVLPKVVFSTIVWSGPIVAKYAAERNAIAAQFVQGYEAYFWSGTRYIEATESYSSTKHLVTTSNWLFNMVSRHLSPDQDIQQLPLVVNEEIFFSGNLSRDIDIILVFRSSSDKGQWVLAELLDRLMTSDKSIVVFCATDYLFLETKYGKRAQFIKLPIDQYSIAKIMRRAKVFVDASLHEGYGLIPLEAALCGCSLVLSDSGGVRDFVHHYKGKLIANLLDVEKIIDSINSSLSDFDKKEFTKSAARQSHSGEIWYNYLQDITKNRTLPFFQPELLEIPKDEFTETLVNRIEEVPEPGDTEENLIELTNAQEQSEQKLEESPVELKTEEENFQESETLENGFLESELSQPDQEKTPDELAKPVENPLHPDSAIEKIYKTAIFPYLPRRVHLALKVLLSGRDGSKF